MNIIKLNAIDSTNTYLLQLARKNKLEGTTVVIANKQTQGRGQMGTLWQSRIGKSLTFSVYKQFKKMDVDHQNTISQAVSIGFLLALKQFFVPELAIKWPNDIMSYSKKLAGILIENQVKQGKIVSSVIGIGLNVNTNLFNNLPFATSMQDETGNHYNIEEVFEVVIKSVLQQLEDIDTIQISSLKSKYDAFLFRKDKVTFFKTPNGDCFNGIIKGVSSTGELQVLLENDVVKLFKMKELQMLLV